MEKTIRKTVWRLLMTGLAVMALTIAVPGGTVHATSDTRQKLQDAKEQKKETEKQKSQTEDTIDSMENTKASLEGELGNLTEQLTKVSNNLEDIENRIIDKNDQIDQTKKELEEAKETEKWQYECMKKRIQFMYERSGNAYLDALFSATSFSDFLNRGEYIRQLTDYDHKMMEEYKQTREEIEQKEADLEKDMEELEEMQAEAEAEHQKFSGLVSKTKGTISGYSGQISAAEAQVEALEAQMALQEQNIAALQKKLEEEIAKSRLAAQSAWRDISEVTFTQDDRYLLANLIYCEAGGEPYAGQVAVGAVVINRVLSSVFPNTVSGVIYQDRQFSPVASGRLALALAENRATANCYSAADEAMSGVTNVGNCVFFRTPIPGLTGQQIGGHIFY